MSKYKIECGPGFITVAFESKTAATAVRQLEFCSRLMYGLSPNAKNVWVPQQRLSWYVDGFPPDVSWSFQADIEMRGQHLMAAKALSAYLSTLRNAIDGITPSKNTDEGGLYRFSCTDGKGHHDYAFTKRARAIKALAVLYDLEWHPRKDLEIWLKMELSDRPNSATHAIAEPEQYYGDPSKIADELRNEGWPREAAAPVMFVESRPIGGQAQQHYRIATRLQGLDHQKQRSVIKPSWRAQLYKRDSYTCKICQTNYVDAPDQLAPDHRVPVVFESDDLNDANFTSKLMTLCRYCNQAKREFAKRVPHDYNWAMSPWAYPEKFRVSMLGEQIALLREQSPEDYESLLERLGLTRP